MGHSRHRFERHLDHLVHSGAGRGGDQADAAGIVFAMGIEGSSSLGGGVSRVLTATGRVDPLPIGGHGAS
jgi:hypothetical protein